MPVQPTSRRRFAAGAAALATAMPNLGKPLGKLNPGRVLGANDRINVGIVGVGGRGFYVGEKFELFARSNKDACQIVQVCDVYQKRVNLAKQRFRCEGTLDWRAVVDNPSVDAVIVATPDHWHARIALAAMDKGKDVYLEKPMCHTIEEVKQLIDTVRETRRVVQVGSQTTSGDQWWKARKAIADGMLGNMLMSQGSYHRNSTNGEWNWKIDPNAGPDKTGDDYIDWKTFTQASANPKRPYDADRFFRFRKYWDYSGGIATDLFFHVMAPMNICWGEPQYPYRVTGSGGIYQFKDEREVPDTFHLMAEYKKGFSVVLSSCMANSEHIPGLIRGHLGSLVMVEHGRFESYSEYITVKPEARVIDAEYKARWGADPIKIAVEENDTMLAHIGNFLGAMRTREKPRLDVETAARAQVAITMAVQSFRQGKVLYFDEAAFKVVDKPPKA